MTAQVRVRGTLIITGYPAVCRCSGPRDGRGQRMTHYTENPDCVTAPATPTDQRQ